MSGLRKDELTVKGLPRHMFHIYSGHPPLDVIRMIASFLCRHVAPALHFYLIFIPGSHGSAPRSSHPMLSLPTRRIAKLCRGRG